MTLVPKSKSLVAAQVAKLNWGASLKHHTCASSSCWSSSWIPIKLNRLSAPSSRAVWRMQHIIILVDTDRHRCTEAEVGERSAPSSTNGEKFLILFSRIQQVQPYFALSTTKRSRYPFPPTRLLVLCANSSIIMASKSIMSVLSDSFIGFADCWPNK